MTGNKFKPKQSMKIFLFQSMKNKNKSEKSKHKIIKILFRTIQGNSDGSSMKTRYVFGDDIDPSLREFPSSVNYMICKLYFQNKGVNLYSRNDPDLCS